MSASVLYFDIESYRTRKPKKLEEIRREVLKKEPAESWSKAKKEAFRNPEAQEQRVREAIAATAKDPLLAEPLCIGFARDDEEPQILSAMEDGRSEEAMLREFADVIRDSVTDETILSVHNGEKYDLRVILNRYRHYRILPPPQFPRFHAGRWFGARIADTMLMVPSSSGVNMVAFTDACDTNGTPAPKTSVLLEDSRPLCGALVGYAYETGQHEAIRRYCLGDVVNLRALYQACTFNGQWGMWTADAALEEDLDNILNVAMKPEMKLRNLLKYFATTGRIPPRYAGLI